VLSVSAASEAHAKLSGLSRWRGPDHPETRAAKIALEEAKLEELINKAMDQRAIIAALENGGDQVETT
jgi:hypothetical protein